MEEKFDTAIQNSLAMIRANVPADDAVKFAAAIKDLVEARRMFKLDEKK